MTLPFDPENERTIREYAASLSTRDLTFEIIEQMTRALEINNSGLFRVASLLMVEYETRADTDQSTRKRLADYRKLIDYAVEATHAKGRSK
jgi:hypothetical protein